MNKFKDIHEFKRRILDPFDFSQMALELFRFQYQHNIVYRLFCDSVSKTPANTSEVHHIPYLPISLFKRHLVTSRDDSPLGLFSSSGTASMNDRSKHAWYDPAWYKLISKKIFEGYFKIQEPIILLAALPGYEERSDASLLCMVDHFISTYGAAPLSGFYGKDWVSINKAIERALEQSEIQVVLWGVTHALLDYLNEVNTSHLPENRITIIETGGMKGLRKEMIKEELFSLLKFGFKTDKIISEYGMTELTSQAYASNSLKFTPGFSMKVSTRSMEDPNQELTTDTYGLLKIIDLANVDTCAFIETEDIGKVYADGTFEVIGRVDYSDLRGCNLMRF